MNPIMLSTWSFGLTATAEGWPVLTGKKPDALGAVEAACRAVEDDPTCRTVGYGGLPDRSGRVTLDAAIMLSPARSGAVAAATRTRHPITLARAVMEQTHHKMLVGDGADQFAEQLNLPQDELLTDNSQNLYERWLKKFGDRPGDPRSFGSVKNLEEQLAGDDDEPPHDTVCVLALDADGTLAAAGSTSGWPFKMPGRVGDTPIIGHGIYVNPKVGAACATGSGELVSGMCGSFLAVENMRRGMTCLDAIADVLQRIADSFDLHENHQVGMAVLRRDGRFATGSIRPGYQTAVRSDRADKLIKSHRVIIEG